MGVNPGCKRRVEHIHNDDITTVHMHDREEEDRAHTGPGVQIVAGMQIAHEASRQSDCAAHSHQPTVPRHRL